MAVVYSCHLVQIDELYYTFIILIFKWLVHDSVIVRVRVVLKRTVVGDWRFDNLSGRTGSHLQSQVNSVLSGDDAISNGNRTEWSRIRSVITRVITKSGDRAAGVRFYLSRINHKNYNLREKKNTKVWKGKFCNKSFYTVLYGDWNQECDWLI